MLYFRTLEKQVVQHEDDRRCKHDGDKYRPVRLFLAETVHDGLQRLPSANVRMILGSVTQCSRTMVLPSP